MAHEGVVYMWRPYEEEEDWRERDFIVTVDFQDILRAGDGWKDGWMKKCSVSRISTSSKLHVVKVQPIANSEHSKVPSSNKTHQPAFSNRNSSHQ
jgi:hypothetical protein